MSSEETIGHCLCGRVTIRLEDKPAKIDACHCDDCRRWGSGPLFTLGGATDVTIEGSDDISVYESSEWASRSFCSHCGSHLYYFLKPTSQYMLSPGLFGNLGDLNMDMQVFIDEKPAYYSIPEGNKKLTGTEVMALFEKIEPIS